MDVSVLDLLLLLRTVLSSVPSLNLTKARYWRPPFCLSWSGTHKCSHFCRVKSAVYTRHLLSLSGSVLGGPAWSWWWDVWSIRGACGPVVSGLRARYPKQVLDGLPDWDNGAVVWSEPLLLSLTISQLFSSVFWAASHKAGGAQVSTLYMITFPMEETIDQGISLGIVLCCLRGGMM
jgi:hypothetical protein